MPLREVDALQDNHQIILSAKDLSVEFDTPRGTVHALRGIDIELYKGSTLAIVGESGSGKSVTAYAVMGLLPKNAKVNGEVFYKGQRLELANERKMDKIRGSCISMVFQDPLSSLDPLMKIGRQIYHTLRLGGASKSRAKARAIELLKEVGIASPKERYNKYPHQLSGGMRQRVVLAMALALNADVLICDEPTTALDVTVQAQVLELIQSIKKSRGLSVIFITHDLGVVAKMADRVAVMYAGKVVEYGTAEDIFYCSRHPYTWGLLCAKQGDCNALTGIPPDMLYPPEGDAFAQRNGYAMKVDLKYHPPMFQISPTHKAATWLLHPDAPKVTPPRHIVKMQRRYEQYLKENDRESVERGRNK